MKRSRRPIVNARRRIFFGGEGESEASYGALLGEFDNQRSRKLHIDTVALNGGDPLAIVQAAQRRIRDREQKRGAYALRALMLDADKLGISRQRDDEAQKLIAELGLVVVWQTPCHEALLLRHLPLCATLQPPTTAEAQRQLQSRWAEYQRPMVAMRLAERITYDSVLRAAAVEQGLQSLLSALDI